VWADLKASLLDRQNARLLRFGVTESLWRHRVAFAAQNVVGMEFGGHKKLAQHKSLGGIRRAQHG
jgi:hypothetical protein